MEDLLVRAVAVAAVVAVATLAGAWLRRRDGALRHGDATDRVGADHLRAVGLDLSSAAAGAVLIGAPTCTPCDTVKQVLGDIQRERDDFRWVYADAADHLALTAAHRVMRVPTVLLLANDGRIVARTSGVPRSDDLKRVIDDARLAAAA